MKYIKLFENINRHNINKILDGYLETALWTEEEQLRYDRGIDGLYIHDVSSKSIKEIKKQLQWFLDNSGDILDDTRDDVIGHDLWLTRNGHGAGFFDRSYYTDFEKEILDELANQLGYSDLDVEITDGQDYIIYLYSTDNYKNFDIEKFKEKIEFDKTIKKYNL